MTQITGTVTFTAQMSDTDPGCYAPSEGKGEFSDCLICGSFLLLITAATGGSSKLGVFDRTDPKLRSSPARWRQLSSTNGHLEMPNGGDQQTASLILDIDKDGVNDFVIAERTQAPSVVWYRRGSSGWKKYVIDDSPLPIEAGGTYYDIDADGDADIVFAGDGSSNQMWWWENPFPHFKPDVAWKRRYIKNGGPKKHHDQLFGDVDGDGKAELITWNQKGKVLLMLDIPFNPREHKGNWRHTVIARTSNERYEGMAIADVDLDGKDDIVGAGRWYRHIKEKEFEEHLIDSAAGREFTRTAVGQLVVGSRCEVVIVPGDADGALKWYEWNGVCWDAHTLKELVIHGHSLAVEDINGDGQSDIFVAEMGEPGHGAEARAWVYYGDGTGSFTESVVSVGVANHESKTSDLDGDGDIDILSKPYHYKAPRIDVFLNSCGDDK